MSRESPLIGKAIPHDLDPERCAQLVWDFGPGWTRRSQCRRPARYTEEDKKWCFQHRPSYQRIRRETAVEAHKMRWERTYKPRAFAANMLQVIKDISAGIVQDPQALCKAFMIRYEQTLMGQDFDPSKED